MNKTQLRAADEAIRGAVGWWLEWSSGKLDPMTLEEALEHAAWYQGYLGSVVRVRVVKGDRGGLYEVALHV